MLLLAIGSVALVLVLIWTSHQENARLKSAEDEIRKLRSELGFRVNEEKKLRTLIENCDSTWKSQLGEKYREQHEFNARVGRELDRLTKEHEVISIRQRTLEKRIIGAERVVTVNVHGVDPKKLSVSKQPKKRGAGHGALIPEATV